MAWTELPDELPVPVDDGAAAHLVGAALPAIGLAATAGTTVRLDELTGRTVVFVYPRTGRPDEDLPYPLIERLTLFVADGRIEDVQYPVFPPDRGADLALERLR